MMKAKLSFIISPWSGFSKMQPSDNVLELFVKEGDKIDSKKIGGWGAEFSIISIKPNRVKLLYDHLSVREAGKGINLYGPFKGEFNLDLGQAKEFSTPTMDSGTTIEVTLKMISTEE